MEASALQTNTFGYTTLSACTTTFSNDHIVHTD